MEAAIATTHDPGPACLSGADSPDGENGIVADGTGALRRPAQMANDWYPTNGAHASTELVLELFRPLHGLRDCEERSTDQSLHGGRGRAVGDRRRQHQHRRGGVGHDLLERVLATAVGNVEVERDDPGTQRRDQTDRFDGCRRLSNHLDVAVGLEDCNQLGALYERVLDDDDARRGAPVVGGHADVPTRRSTAASRLRSSNELFTM